MSLSGIGSDGEHREPATMEAESCLRRTMAEVRETWSYSTAKHGSPALRSALERATGLHAALVLRNQRSPRGEPATLATIGDRFPATWCSVTARSPHCGSQQLVYPAIRPKTAGHIPD